MSIPRWAGRPLNFGSRTLRPYWFRILAAAGFLALLTAAVQPEAEPRLLIQVEARSVPVSGDLLREIGVDLWSLESPALPNDKSTRLTALSTHLLDPEQSAALHRDADNTDQPAGLRITTADGQQVRIEVPATQAYIADYELSSGLPPIAELADPILMDLSPLPLAYRARASNGRISIEFSPDTTSPLPDGGALLIVLSSQRRLRFVLIEARAVTIVEKE